MLLGHLAVHRRGQLVIQCTPHTVATPTSGSQADLVSLASGVFSNFLYLYTHAFQGSSFSGIANSMGSVA